MPSSTPLTSSTPRRGEIWLVALDPTEGDELNKTRPAVVMSSDAVGILRVKLIVPLTGWNPSHDKKLWLVPVDPSGGTGLNKRSSADTLQMRSVALERFDRRLGQMPAPLMEEIAAAIAVVVEYQ